MGKKTHREKTLQTTIQIIKMSNCLIFGIFMTGSFCTQHESCTMNPSKNSERKIFGKFFGIFLPRNSPGNFLKNRIVYFFIPGAFLVPFYATTLFHS